MWFAIMQLILYQFVMPDLVNTMSTLLLRLPFSRRCVASFPSQYCFLSLLSFKISWYENLAILCHRMEMEADYIGLLLMASAGYDPRIAPTVYERLGKVTGDSALRDYLSTHPSGKKRAQLLAEAKVMEEALAIYREVRTGRGMEGFL